ncbi:hypothetical protein D7X94_07700 [Acutalibacter sp. 1XD8-33]|uniref:DUF6442 family protein n=1 Tax=Acutalibacter sp. 1XD8-33 TaxID=2320081 RepID=UPI000EA20C89|nr:DUF6442 family protein [Acutalibacter sp. 1XD8-33]RKJ40599.1 hypothetical protein D7X94_07700 [Acutalibacter sp. 1XD8-33]
MNREEILEKSRAENRNQDMVEQEALKRAAVNGNIAVLVLVTLFFIANIVVGKGIHWGLYAMITCGNAATFWTKYVRLKKWHEGLLAAAYTLLTLALSAAYLYELI